MFSAQTPITTLAVGAALAEGYPQADAEIFGVSAYSLLRSGQFRPRLKLTGLDNPRPASGEGIPTRLDQCELQGLRTPETGRIVRAWDYPFDIVRLKCDKCGRYGQYSKDRFIELVGAGTSLPEARYIIAKDCSREKNGLAMQNRCGVGYPDLARKGVGKG